MQIIKFRHGSILKGLETNLRRFYMRDEYGMKSMMKRIEALIIILIIIITLSGCTDMPRGSTDTNGAAPIISNAPYNDNEVILEICKNINSIIEDRRYENLAQYIHPEKGVRFGQFGFINIEINPILMASQIEKVKEDKTIYSWGIYAGSGDPIELTINEYFEKFIYIEDFSQAETGYNTNLTSSGYPDDIPDIFPNTNTVEYYFSGFDPQYEGLDWKSIKYIFEKYDGNWFIVGIIENQWSP